MAMIRYDDEKDLQRRICKILNKGGYNFVKEKDSFFCDIVDYNVKVFGEIKTRGEFAPHQLIYGIVKNDVRDAKYLILANEYEARIYDCPYFEDMVYFAKKISDDFEKAPSSIIKRKYISEAFEILGLHKQIYTYNTKFKIDDDNPCIFLDDSNYEYFQLLLQKYRINPSEFIKKFSKTWVEKSRLFIKNDDKTIFDQESGNEVKAHRKITNEFDKILIRSTRIKPKNIEEILHKIDALAPLDVRRKRGKYWSNLAVSDIVIEIIRDVVDPTFVFEPFVGGGSLVRDMVPEIQGIVNDIDKGMVGMLEDEWEGYGWKFHKKNFLTTPIMEVLNEWGIPEKTDRFLIFTNPPFGTSATTRSSSKTKERGKKSRKNKIDYGSDSEKDWFMKTYGKGDLCIPSIAHIMEIVKNRGNGYIAFFSPFGVMLGRRRFNKLLKMLLKDFEFLFGEVFSGTMFNNVSEKKAISFTVWKYNKGIETPHEDLSFIYGEESYKLKVLPLLKDLWNYDTRKRIKEEIAVQVNYSFGSTIPKVFHVKVEKGGSEVIPENVKYKLGIDEIRDELAYSLWSVLAGRKSNILDYPNYPLMFDNCYTHVPDFRSKKVMEVLAYTILYTILFEIENNYCNGKIGFVGMMRKFVFGRKEITDNACKILENCSNCVIGDKSIGTIFKDLKNGNSVSDDTRLHIRKEIMKRLDDIGYWEYLPIPDIRDNEDDNDLVKVNGIGKSTASILQKEGIKTIEDLSRSTVEFLSTIDGIGKSTAIKYINNAKKHGLPPWKIEDD
jgi:hypothetical protein